MVKAAHESPRWGRRKRAKQLVLACLIVALVAVLLGVRKTGTTTVQPRGMAPPAGYSAGQLIWNSQATAKASGFHTTGAPANPSYLSVAEVQVYAPPR